MAAPSQAIVPTDAELLQAQADLWRHSLYYLTSKALKCAVELHIPTAIHDLGGATTLPELVNALSLPQTKLPFLGRVMRLLVTSGIFASNNGDGAEAVYRFNSLSWLLAGNVTAAAIIKAFPDIKCTVLNLPRVVETTTTPAAPAHDAVSDVTGDLFHTIPPAQAVMLKV
ncbi:unnamed protein product [Miscanthus lutarioriparius]|uniref:Plant methyltransferase dimerisation domain-containing protein n=1 Tax=Miscanthus lutarioriparius TaxID=422564 RepID=A0A811QXU1_9POAL|nr:unnamed protein product [Miscanthus lutarioriparius]